MYFGKAIVLESVRPSVLPSQQIKLNLSPCPWLWNVRCNELSHEMIDTTGHHDSNETWSSIFQDVDQTLHLTAKTTHQLTGTVLSSDPTRQLSIPAFRRSLIEPAAAELVHRLWSPKLLSFLFGTQSSIFGRGQFRKFIQGHQRGYLILSRVS